MTSHSDSRLLRLVNGQRVVDALLDVAPGSISRAELVRVTKLSKPTISSVMEVLERAGVVRATESGSPSGEIGRPAVLYTIVPESVFVLGVDLGGSKVVVGIADLLGNVFAETMFETAHDATAALDQIAAATDTLTRRIPADIRHIGAACIGVPGIYRHETDSVEASMTLGGFPGVKVGQELRKRLGLDVIIENDVNLAAVAEAWRGHAQGVAAFAAISVGTGIGMGLVLNGALYRGGRAAAGELGSVKPFGHRHEGGRTLEAFASAEAIRAALWRALDRGAASALGRNADLPSILDAYAGGDDAAVAAVEPAIEAMTEAVHDVVMLFDPSMIVFGGGVGANPIFARAVGERLSRLAVEMPPLVASTLGRRAAFLGAVATALGAARNSLVGQRLLTASR